MRWLKVLSGGISLALVLAGARFTPALCADADWVLLDENQGSNFFYDRNGTTVPKPGVLRVQTRVVYTKQGKSEALKTLASPKPMETLYESRYLYDLDCSEHESRLLEVTHLDKKGGVLKITNLSSFTDWEDIPPDSRMEMVEDLACSK